MKNCYLSLSAALAISCCALPVAAQETVAPVSATTPAPTPAAASDAATSERPARVHIGDATAALLTTQANGTAAGPALPMLGATAQASWLRYQESFKNKIPEFFGSRVRSNTVNTTAQ